MELEMEKAPISVTLIHPGRIDTPYNEHAQSYYDHQVAHRGMVYPPSAVAEAILFAAAHQKRDMYVGAQAKVLKMLGDFAPRFMDKLMELITDPGQVDPDRPSVNPKTNALYKAGYGMRENGSHEGWFRTGSIYVKMQEHPLFAAAAVAGLGLAINAVSKARKNSKAALSDGAAGDMGTTIPDPTAFSAADSQSDTGIGEMVIMTEIEAY